VIRVKSPESMAVEQKSSSTNEKAVCPESTIESANKRSYVPTKSTSNQSSCPNLACESTIDSAPRRDFIRKAALVTAAAGVGGVFLGKNSLVRESSADVRCANIIADSSLYADYCGLNNGSNWSPGLIFGSCTIFPTCKNATSITSPRASCSPNRFGIDFWAGTGCLSAKRMSLTATGKLGIGTCSPSSTLCVVGSISAESISATSSAGTAVKGTAPFVGVCGTSCNIGVYGLGNGIGVRATANSLTAIPLVVCGLGGADLQRWQIGCIVTNVVNKSGWLGIGTTTPTTALDVNGTILAGPAAPGTVALITKGAPTQTANLQQWEKGSTVKSVVNKCGWLGIGTGAPATPLQVNGTASVTNLGAGTTSPGAMVDAVSTSATAKAIIAKGAASQTAHLQEWQNSSGTPLSVVDASGRLGIGNSAPTVPLQVNGIASASSLGLGTTTPKTTLAVNGSVSAKVAIKTAAYTMTASDFAVLVNATSAALTITLPPASNTGMVVLVKKIDGNTSHAVTVSRSGTDTIEGATTKLLTSQYQSVTLIAGGNGVWYVLSNAT
jgi:hypothetical protein